jgi:cyanophycin synthetase
VFTLHSLRTAEEFLERMAEDCVVKPAKNTGAGQGVTTGIRSRPQLGSAVARAAAFGRELLIEEQVPGDNYRLLYLGGRLLDAIVRRPPRVKGDGKKTVRDLVDGANRERLSGGNKVAQVLVPVDREMKHTLAKQGLSLKSVPPEGQLVILKTVVNDNAGSENETASHCLCESIVDAGANAAKALGVTLAGVDIITQDPTRALSETGGVILEVNTSPGFYFHYRKKDGPFPVARFVLAELFGGDVPDAKCPS